MLFVAACLLALAADVLFLQSELLARASRRLVGHIGVS